MAVYASSGPAVLLESGQSTTFAGHPLLLRIDLPDAEPITVEFAFDASGGEPQVASTPVAGGIRLVLRGFDGADGRGTALPALLGEVGGDLLFLHFRVFRWGETPDRTVIWTLYRTDREAVASPGAGPSAVD